MGLGTRIRYTLIRTGNDQYMQIAETIRTRRIRPMPVAMRIRLEKVSLANTIVITNDPIDGAKI
jgi:hypothetical protein